MMRSFHLKLSSLKFYIYFVLFLRGEIANLSTISQRTTHPLWVNRRFDEKPINL